MDKFKIQSKPFVIALIEELKADGFISEAIKIPFLLGAYKVKMGVQTIDVEFLRKVYNDVIDSLADGRAQVYFRECSSSKDFAIALCAQRPKEANAVIVHNGIDVIYCADPLLGKDSIIDSSNAQMYFLNKFIKIGVKYCNFSDVEKIPVMRELDLAKYFLTKSELDVIKTLL